MRFNKQYNILVIILMLISTSCSDDYIELEPTDFLVPEIVFTSVVDLEQGVLGAYNAIPDELYLSDVTTNNTILTPENRGQGTFLHNWQYTSTNAAGAQYASYYAVIARANYVLEAAPNITPSDGELNKYNSAIAEARALRGFAHLELLRIFSQDYNPESLAAAYVDRTGSDLMPARETVEVLTQKIADDLNSALTGMSKSVSDLDPSRMTYYAVKAALVRLYLFTKNYDGVISEASDIIDAMPNNLSVSEQEFVDTWLDRNDKGILFKVVIPATGGKLGNLFWEQSTDDVHYSPSNELRNLYSEDDYRNNWYSMDADGVNPVFTKYAGGNASVPNLADLKIFRMSEIYLSRAEAYASKSSPNIALAAKDYNRLRKFRIPNYLDESFSTASDANNKIFDERRRELVIEGHYFFDLKRLNKSIVRQQDDCELAVACTLESNNYRFSFPIPQVAMDANSNLIQNNNY